MEYKRLNRFKGIDVSEESTDASEQSLRLAQNVVLRPRGSVSRMPPFRKLWNTDNISNYASALGITASDKTCLLLLQQPPPDPAPIGVEFKPAFFIAAHDFKNNKGMGIFSVVDISQELGSEFTEFLPDYIPFPYYYITVLKKGLAENKRWFFYRFYDAVVLGNGVDENLIYQHARTGLRLRTMGSDAQSVAPIVSNDDAVVAPIQNASAQIVFNSQRYLPPDKPLASVGVIFNSNNQALPYIEIKWTPTETASEYQIQISKSYDFNNLARNESTNITQYISILDFNTTYFFRVRAKYGGVFSPYSDVNYIKTLTEAETAEINQGTPSQTPTPGKIITKTEIQVNAGILFRGEAGNNLKIKIISTGNSLSSTRTGEGTQSNPIIYTLYGVGAVSVNDFINFVKNDINAQNILTFNVLSSDSELSDFPLTQLTGGTGSEDDPGRLPEQAKAVIEFDGNKINPPPRPLSETDAVIGAISGVELPLLKVKWTPTDAALGYEVDLSENSNFINKITKFTTSTFFEFGNPTTSSINELLFFGKKYFYQVRAKYNNNLISPPSDVGSNFTMFSVNSTKTNQGEPSQIPIEGITKTKNIYIVTAGQSFIGKSGNFIQIEFVETGSLSSTRTGEGTFESPLVYTVFGVGSERAVSVVNYINNDEIIKDILSISSSVSDFNTRFPSIPKISLTGGIGTGTRTEDPLEGTGEIATSFFDPGVNGLGFSSGLSIPTSVRTSGIKTITPSSNTSGEFARYSKFRVWYRQPTVNQANKLSANTWLLLGECNNAPGATFRAALPRELTDESIFFDGTDINRLPPCTMFELCEGKIFASGNPANPTRIWYSQPVHKTELLPEGFNLSKKYIDMPARKEEGSNAKVTHLKAMEQRLQVHTSRGITLIHGSTFVRAFSRSDFGAMNPAAATSWSHHISPYLGADGVLYEMSNQQALKSNIASAASWDFIRSFADTAELERNPWRANVAGDLTNQLVWVWLPCKIDGVTRLSGFLFDYESKGFSGPITWPGLISTTKLSAVDPRIVGQTEAGDLVVIDSKDINRDEFQPAETFEGNFLSVSPNKLFFQTQFMDFGVPHEQKAYLEFMFNTVRGSYAENIVITLETDEGRTKTFNYGQLRGERNKCAFMLSGYAVRLGMEVTLASNRPFVLRDAVLGYDRQKTR